MFERTLQFITEIHQLEDRMNDQSVNSDLTVIQQKLLQILYFSSPKNLSTLSKCMNMNMPNCSREVKKMVQLNYIQKSCPLEDRRITELSLSLEGIKKEEALLKHMKENFTRQYKHYGEDQIKLLIHAMDTLEQLLNG